MIWLPMILTFGGTIFIYENRFLTGAFFILISVLIAYFSSFDNFFIAKRKDILVFSLFFFLSYAAFHEIVKHALNADIFRYFRDVLFILVIVIYFATYFRGFLYISRTKLLILSVPALGVLGILLSHDEFMALWSFRDSYLYSVCALLAAAIASREVLIKFSYLLVSIALVNLVVGFSQQLGSQEYWISIGYGEIATSVWQGMQRPWGTFDRSLTYGHFLLFSSILGFFVLRMPFVGTLLLLGAYLSFNRSVLVSSILVTFAVVFSDAYRSSRAISIALVILGGIFIYPLIDSVLLSLFDPEFRSNSERISDYIAILSLGLPDLLTGGYMGLIGSNAGRFSLTAEFTSGIAHIHSGYLTLILELGLVGALLFLIIILMLFIKHIRAVSKYEKVSILLIFLMFALSMFTHNMQSNIPNNIFFWAFIGLFSIYYARSQQEGQPHRTGTPGKYRKQ